MANQFKSLNLWTLPDHYAGDTYFDYYPVLGQSRDSDCLERTNFEVAKERLKEQLAKDLGTVPYQEAEHVIIARAGHWACGWVETLMVHRNAPTSLLELADDMRNEIKNGYPVLDDQVFSDAEEQEREETWTGNGDSMVRGVLKELEIADDVRDTLADDDRFVELVRRCYWEDCFYRGNDDAWLDLDRLALHLRSWDTYSPHDSSNISLEYIASTADLLGIDLNEKAA